GGGGSAWGGERYTRTPTRDRFAGGRAAGASAGAGGVIPSRSVLRVIGWTAASILLQRDEGRMLVAAHVHPSDARHPRPRHPLDRPPRDVAEPKLDGQCTIPGWPGFAASAGHSRRARSTRSGAPRRAWGPSRPSSRRGAGHTA